MKKIVLSLSLLCSTMVFGQIENGLQAAYNLNGNFEEVFGGESIVGQVNSVYFVDDKFGNAQSAIRISTNTPYGLAIPNELFCSDEYSITFLFKIDGIGSTSSFNNAYPIFFVKKEDNSYFERILLAYEGYDIYLKWAKTSNSTDRTAAVQFTPGMWLHAAIVYSGTRAELYINGQYVDAVESNSTLSCDGSAKGYLGNVSVDNSAGKMLGGFDRIRIYDRLLDSNEVGNIYYLDYGSATAVLGLNDVASSMNVIVAPNPANETAMIKADGLANAFNTVEVLDLNGRVHATMKVTTDEVALPTELLAAGMYVAKLTGNTVKTVRFQVTK